MDKAKDTDIYWSSETEQENFNDKGLKSFMDIWTIELSETDFEIKNLREHSDRYSGIPNRRTVALSFDNNMYFLKRCSDKAFNSIINEFEANKILAEFRLVTPKIVAYAFDCENRRGFIIFKKLGGFFSLREFSNYIPPPDIVANFEMRKKELYERIVIAFLKIRKNKYFYPDWLDKHLFVNIRTGDIALIDLERFMHISKCPWFYRIKPITYFKRRKELRNIRRTLGAGFVTGELLKQLAAKT